MINKEMWKYIVSRLKNKDLDRVLNIIERERLDRVKIGKYKPSVKLLFQ